MILFLAIHGGAASSALPRGGAQAQDVTYVLQGVQGMDLALPADALAHLVAALVDLADVAADQEFHQALVARAVSAGRRRWLRGAPGSSR